MTRRKRSPSPTSSRKRVPFEIPVSLQQLSALSRSLAKQSDTISGVEDKERERLDIAAQARVLGQSPIPNPPPPQNPQSQRKPSAAAVKFVPQKQSFPDAQPWPKPQLKNPAPTPIDPFALYRRQQEASQALEANRTSFPAAPNASSERSRPHIVAPTHQEPIARPGETLSLTKHPSQIAALITKKRAENEANRNRQRWAKAQSEHLAKVVENAPVAENAKGLQPKRDSPTHSRNVSNGSGGTTPSRPVSSTAENAVRSVETPSRNRAVIDPATANRSHDYQQDEDMDSMFTSPVVSPKVFHFDGVVDMESAQTTANHYVSNRDGSHQLPSPSVSIPSQPDTQRPISSRAVPKTHQHPTHSTMAEMIPIPPLFSDRPKPNPPNSQSQRAVQQSVQRSQMNSSFSNSAIPNQQMSHQQSQPQQFINNNSNSNMNVGYYKINPQLWTSSGGDGVTMPSASGSYPQAMSVLASSTASAYYGPTTNGGAVYQQRTMPPTGAGYGSFANGGGVNASFRNATQGAFSVPKR